MSGVEIRITQREQDLAAEIATAVPLMNNPGFCNGPSGVKPLE